MLGNGLEQQGSKGERMIQATYSDFKVIKTRQVAQLIFEVPLEMGERAIKQLGMPMPDREIWVEIDIIKSDF